MPDIQPTDLKSWRKQYHLSQVRFMMLSGLSLRTITRLEAGSHVLRGKALAKLIQAMKDVEASYDSLPVFADSQQPILTKLSPLVLPNTLNTKKQVSATPVGLTSLDLELINRVLQMSAQEKLKLLKSWIEE